MATKQVLFDPKLLLSPDQTQGERRNTTINPAFRNMLRATFLREAMNKKAGDVGWEDKTKQVPIPNTGYKNLDKNTDGKVDIDDLKTIFPQKANTLSKINQAIDKKEGDPEWEDKTGFIQGYKYADVNGDGIVNEDDAYLIRRYLDRGWQWGYRPWGYWHYHPWWRQQEYNPRYDVNNDGRIDYEDINEVYNACGKMRGQPDWEQRIGVIKEGAKRADFNHDRKIDKEDLFFILNDIENLQLLREAFGKKVGDVGWEDKTRQEIIPNTGYKNLDINVDNKVDEKDLMMLFSVVYEDGSLIKGTSETTYLMMGGTKKLIPDDKTFKNLEFDKSKIITISDEELNIIPTGEAIPAIKYDNGTLIKLASDSTYYLMSYGLKRRIPDEETLKALNLDKTKAIELSKEEFDKILPGQPMPTAKYPDGSLIKGANNEFYLITRGIKRLLPDDLTLKNLDLDKTKAISVSTAELENIPEGDRVPHFEYPIGTILKNAETNDEKYYLITSQGEKKLIPDIKDIREFRFGYLKGNSG